MPSLSSYTTIQQAFIAYYQRPADPAGLRFWADRLEANGGNIGEVIDAFGNSQESEDLYGPINSSTIGDVIDAIYLALFNRAPDAAGKQFYIDGFNAGTFTAASIAYNVLVGAQNEDAVAVTNKTQVSMQFTAAVDGRPYTDMTFGQGTSFAATYDGEADAIAAREMLAGVTYDPATVLNQSQIIGFIQTSIADPGDTILNLIPGATLSLTTGLDTIQVPPGGSTDLVKGFFTWDGVTAAGSTLTPADSITGNGNTIFRLAVDVNGNSVDAPFFEASGINQFQVQAADSGLLWVNGATLGDIGSVSLSGAPGLGVGIDNLSLSDKVDVSVANADGSVYISGTLDGLSMSATVYNDSASGSTLSLSTAAINMQAGDDSYVYADLWQTADGNGPQSVGDLTIGDVTMTGGDSASVTLYLTNSASAFGSGAATVGNLAVGNVAIDMGDSGSAELYLYNSAYASNGAATVGSVTVGDVDVSLGVDASLDYMWVSNSSYAKGNATAGDITFGNVTVVGATSAWAEIGFSNEAYSFNKGTATVGSITGGNVDMAGSGSGTLYFSVYNSAYAQNGKATAGNVTIGDVSMSTGDSGDAYVYVYNSADANTGAATVGNLTVGDVHLHAGVNGSASISVSNEASTNKGAAVAGTVMVGDVTGSVGVDGYLRVDVYNYAFGTAGDVAGDLTIGDVDLYGSADANINLSVELWADNGSVGNLTIGDTKMRVENGGSLSYSVTVDAAENVGDIKLGDISLSFGSNATLDYFNISVEAADGNVSSFTVGDVSIVTEGVNATTAATGVYVYAYDDIGDITIGDLNINLAKSASLSQSWTFEADTGGLGNISQGNITLAAAENGYAGIFQYFSAEDEIGDVTVGNIKLSAAKSGEATLYHEVYNDDDIGNIVYGNFDITANGKNAYAYAFVSAENDNSHDIGTITAGNVNLLSKGDGADAYLTLSFTSADEIGAVKVGNVTLEMQNTKTGAATNYAGLWVYDDGGASDLTVGDIKVTGNTGVTAEWLGTALVHGDVYLRSEDGVTVGNITVVGGYTNKTPTLMDNLNELSANAANSWFDPVAGASGVTVGNIDYSGYKSAATINVLAWKGAAAITAAQKDTVIFDNKTKNVITLGAGKDTVNITNTNTGKTETGVDQIIGFSTGSDKMVLDLGGSDFAYSAANRTFDQFLAAAATAMANDGIDIFSQKIGTNSFIAFDKDANGTLDFVVEVVGVQIDDLTDFTII